ncbi:hypothetical protein WCE41_06600 [Luteimonas sp. MJ246]|uniref:hypothetical protein n=1 Tax=Luteimonas sp. MJ174 TaxID=3129237 RepID=UPI0031BB24DE
MDRKLIPMLLALALPLAACGRGAPLPGEGGDGAGAAPGVAQPGDQAPGLSAGFVVLTNEPFWQAIVEGGAVVLSGPDVEGRRFAIDADNEADGARLVHASDDAGTISVTLTPGPCEDSMSGAVFPQAAELVIDGIGPVPGCARPAGTPPPAPSGL